MDMKELLEIYLEKNGYKHAPIEVFKKHDQGVTAFIADRHVGFSITIPDNAKDGIFITFEALLDFSIEHIGSLEDQVCKIYERIQAI